MTPKSSAELKQQGALTQISTSAPSSQLSPLALGSDLASLSRFLDRKLLGAPTGWSSVDKQLLGLGALTILQGSPGCNKSTAALQIALFNAKLGRPALIVDEENGKDRTRSRLLCQLSGLSETGVQRMRLQAPTDFDALIAEYVKLPVYVASGIINGPEDLEKLALELVTDAADYSFLVVDSIQALPKIEQEERANLEAWMKRLDRIKLKFNGRLIILATSEKGYAHFDTASLAGAKGSSSIAFKGETVLDFRSLGPGLIRIECVKNRDGARGCSWDLELQLEDQKNLSSFNFLLSPKGELPG